VKILRALKYRAIQDQIFQWYGTSSKFNFFTTVNKGKLNCTSCSLLD
jgi:hypothetical protein